MDAFFKRFYAVPVLLLLGVAGGIVSLQHVAIQYAPPDDGAMLVFDISVSETDPLLLDKTFTTPFLDAVAYLCFPERTEAESNRNGVRVQLRFRDSKEAGRVEYLLKDEASRILRSSDFKNTSLQVSYSSGQSVVHQADYILYLKVKSAKELSVLSTELRNAISVLPGLRINSIDGIPNHRLILKPLHEISGNNTVLADITRQITVQLNGGELYFEGNQTLALQNYSAADIISGHLKVLYQGQHVPINRLFDIEEKTHFEKQMLVNSEPALRIQAQVVAGHPLLKVDKVLKLAFQALQLRLPFKFETVYEYNATDALRADASSLFLQFVQAVAAIFFITLILYRNIKLSILLLVVLFITVCWTFLMFNLLGVKINLLTLLVAAMAMGVVMDTVVIAAEQLSVRKTKLQESLKSSGLIRILVACNLTTLLAFVPIYAGFPQFRTQTEHLLLTAALLLLIGLLVSIAIVAWMNSYNMGISLPDVSGASFSFWLKLFRIRRRFRWSLVLILVFLIGLPVQVFRVPFGESGYERYQLIASWFGGIQVRINNHIGDLYPEFSTQNWNMVHAEIAKPLREGISTWDAFLPVLLPMLKNTEEFSAFHVVELKEGHLSARAAFKTDQDPLPGWKLYNDLRNRLSEVGNAQGHVSFLSANHRFSNAFHVRSGTPILEIFGNDPEQLLWFGQKAARLIDEMGLSESAATVGSPAEIYFPDDIIYLQGRNNWALMGNKSISSEELPVGSNVSLGKNSQGSEVVLQNDLQPNFMILQKTALDPGSAFLIDALDTAVSPVYERISQINRQYKVRIFADVFDIMAVFQIAGQLKQMLDLPAGYYADMPAYSFEDKRISLQAAGYAILVLVFLVFCVNAFALNDWATGLNTLLAMLFTLLSISCYLVLFNLRIAPSHFVSLMLMLGLVVDAVFVLQKEFLWNHSNKEDALKRWAAAFAVGSRPVLVSLFTTVAGLAPFMFGKTQTFWQEFASCTVFSLPLSFLLIYTYTGLFSKENKTVVQ